MYVTVPISDPSEPEWENVASNADEYTVAIRIPSKLVTHDHTTSVTERRVISNANIQLVTNEVCISQLFPTVYKSR